jgi:hypothetical protein
MINVLAQAHVTDLTWTFTDDLTEEHTLSELVWMGLGEISVNVGFIDNDSPVEFDDMSCTLVITEDGIEIDNFSYPLVPIERTDQAYCFSRVIRATAGTELVITASVTNAGDTWSDSLTLVIDPEPVIEEPV